MSDLYRALVVDCSPGLHISDFVNELLGYRGTWKGIIVGIFNDIPLIVKPGDTKEDIFKQYRSKAY